MDRAKFDGLRVLRREWESRAGRSEVCQGADGQRHIRLCLYAAALQKETLSAIDPQIPKRLEQGGLEVLLPWWDGVSLEQWLYERQPTLGQRRDACLSLLEQQIRHPLPPCLAVPAAQAENLRFSDAGAALQYLPDLSRWKSGQETPQATGALAGVICEVMTRGMGRRELQCLPEELRLLCRRTQCGGYDSLGPLQRDVSAVPDELPSLGILDRAPARRVRLWLQRYGRAAVCAIAALLIAAAVLSLAAAVRIWRNERRSSWPGMPTVGDQDLR